MVRAAFTAVQFFIYGKRHSTRTGWLRHRARYEKPDFLEQPLDLSDKVYLVTGANKGIGKEVAQFLATKSASVYLVCRNKERAEAAQREIQAAAAGSLRVHYLLADCSLEADVRRAWDEFLEHRKSVGALRLDGVVCCAGLLNHEQEFSCEGVEMTFACHLLFGTYLLGKLALPVLQSTPGSRFVAVSSGGMQCVPFPEWPTATSTGKAAYDGIQAYAYAKRGQVLLCERWARDYPDVSFLSCHPGWVRTDIVKAWRGPSLEPMRSAWEGSEGIVWLCVAPPEKLRSGEFYLDRAPTKKHLAGAFFRQGKYTKNTESQVDEMMRLLDVWSNAETRGASQGLAGAAEGA